METVTIIRSRAMAGAGCLALALLAACGRAPEAARAERAQWASERAAQDNPAAEQARSAEAEFVTAVSGVGSNEDLKFRLLDRPQVGKILAIELWVVPQAFPNANKLILSLHGDDGLRVESSKFQELPLPASADGLKININVTPLQPGVYNLSATMLVETSATSITRVYNIPVIVI